MRGKNNHKVGAVNEMLAAMHYMEQGYIICWPQETQSSVDFVAIKSGEALKVQVKTVTWSKAGNFSYGQTRLTNRGNIRYEEGDFDELFLVDDANNYRIPWVMVAGRTSLSVGSDNPKYNGGIFEEYKI